MQVDCPNCKKSIEWSSDNPHRPFCCKQCQLIDFGDWANEQNAIPAQSSESKGLDKSQLPEIDVEDIEAMLQNYALECMKATTQNAATSSPQTT